MKGIISCDEKDVLITARNDADRGKNGRVVDNRYDDFKMGEEEEPKGG